MILKPGKLAEALSSYRPISLLLVLSKLFKKLMKIVTELNLIPAHQFGFQHKHSTIDQVHWIMYVIERALEHKKVCSVIFLNVSQALDRVWHEGLNYKLKRNNHCKFAHLLPLLCHGR